MVIHTMTILYARGVYTVLNTRVACARRSDLTGIAYNLIRQRPHRAAYTQPGCPVAKSVADS